jgi:predicted DsbA family dithiol-disulfide isomerase
MTASLRIDFVSDISCPWCAIGLSALEQALERIGAEVQTEFHIQPFELNPQMPPGGQDITEHLAQKYGSTPEQHAGIRETIRQRGAELGFVFRLEGRDRIYNTFDAHRLLHWAGEPGTVPAGRQRALKKALLAAYFTDGEDPSSHEVLARVAGLAGLDPLAAIEILGSDRFVTEVRELEAFFTGAGINSVPAVIVNQQYLISGGQPVEIFEEALRRIAAGTA